MPDVTALQAAQAAVATGDPVLDSIKWVGVALGTLMVVAAPIMMYLRKFHMDRAANSKDAAESQLYIQLQQQIAANAQDIRTLVIEKHSYFEENLKLQARVAKTEEYEKTIESLTKRLEDKDKALEKRDTEQKELLREIITLTSRIHELELQAVQGNLGPVL